MRYVSDDAGILSRLGSAFSYLTAGWGGIIILIVMYLMKKRMSDFFAFNVKQSVIIAFSLFVIGMTWGIIYNLLSHIPIIQIVVAWFDFIFNKPIFLSRSITEIVVASLILYCTAFSILGKYPIIYKISSLIKR